MRWVREAWWVPGIRRLLGTLLGPEPRVLTRSMVFSLGAGAWPRFWAACCSSKACPAADSLAPASELILPPWLVSHHRRPGLACPVAFLHPGALCPAIPGPSWPHDLPPGMPPCPQTRADTLSVTNVCGLQEGNLCPPRAVHPWERFLREGCRNRRGSPLSEMVSVGQRTQTNSCLISRISKPRVLETLAEEKGQTVTSSG